MAGLVSFALAHICYLVQFLSQGVHGNGVLPAIGALVLLALSTEFWLAPHTGQLRRPVRAYVAIICAMASAAVALPAGYGLVLAGAILFLVSDLILSLRLFRLSETSVLRLPSSLALWMCYVAGQALITVGVLQAG